MGQIRESLGGVFGEISRDIVNEGEMGQGRVQRNEDEFPRSKEVFSEICSSQRSGQELYRSSGSGILKV
ncbi:hypothetical protein LENED_010975 [Lentinula edodes]|uniref:Uncharacterized protein n=1 Tax=Lentinula edodes TaxID=5353 RepID=A0A1Q3ENT6_LENED|nr:hypothetical protein LENED_010975 [Lentinula edodes]